MGILNLTQHLATAEQRDAGVVDLPPAERETLQALLTFDRLPTGEQVFGAAKDIAALAARIIADPLDVTGKAPLPRVMIGGAPFLMADLERALRKQGIVAVYAFSVRESVEQAQPDGSVKKTAVFRHRGFVESEG